MRWGICCRCCSSSFCHFCRHSSLVIHRVQARHLHSHHRGTSHVCISRKKCLASTTTSRPRCARSTAAIRGTRGGKHLISRSSRHTYTLWTFGATRSNTHKTRRCKTRKGGSLSTKKPWHKRGTCLCPIAICWPSMGFAGDTRQQMLLDWGFRFCSNY